MISNLQKNIVMPQEEIMQMYSILLEMELSMKDRKKDSIVKLAIHTSSFIEFVRRSMLGAYPVYD